MQKILAVLILTCFIFQRIQATPPTYYAHFYSGYVVLRLNKDTVYGQILMDPISYDDSTSRYHKRPFEKYSGYVIVNCKDPLTHAKRNLFIHNSEIMSARLYYNVVFSDYNHSEVMSLNYSTAIRFLNVKVPISECYTDYQSFIIEGDTILLRKLNTGKADLYDSYKNPEKNITEYFALKYFITPIYTSLFGRTKLYIYTNSKLERIPDRAEFNFNFQRSRFVRRFINKRYGTSFKKRDFKFDRDMFSYISEHG